jgi:hypothetical protein
MLRNADSLYRLELHARDGVIGRVKDFFFDDHYWTIRYMVVETGSWLNSRKVLIATSVIENADWDEGLLRVDLSREQVRSSPDIDTNAPVARTHERGLHEYYGWPAYWVAAETGAGSVAGFAPTAGSMTGMGSALGTGMGVPVTPEPQGRTGRTAPEGDPNLRSGRAVCGYHIEAVDGTIGHVEDYLLNDNAWTLDHIVIDTKNWLPGKKVIVSTEWIRNVVWSESRVHMRLPRETIRQAPEFDGILPVSEEYADSLRRHYGR